MSEARPKRRLPMVTQGSDDEPERPAWHFVITTALTMLFAWILLAWIVNALLGVRVRAGGSDLWVTGANLVVYFASGLGAGALTGRYGTSAGPRQARLGGALTALLGWSVPFVWFVVAGGGALVGLVTWAILLTAMMAVAVLATGLGFRLTRKSATPASAKAASVKAEKPPTI